MKGLERFIKWLYDNPCKIESTFDLARLIEQYMKGGKCK